MINSVPGWLLPRLKLWFFVSSKNSYSESRRERTDKIRREEKLLEVLRSNSKYEKDLNEQIRRTLSLTDVIILETPEEEGKLPELTDDMLDVIDRAVGSAFVILYYYRIEVRMIGLCFIFLTACSGPKS